MLSRIPALTLAASYRQRDDYRYAAAFEAAALEVLGPDLAPLVQGDLIAFQDRGRDRLGNRIPALRERYACFDHPAAREIVDWLDGRYEIGDEELRTQ